MCDEYCCNHGCNQGHDCPARRLAMCRHLQNEPPPPVIWSGWLVDAALAVALVLTVMAMLGWLA